MKRTFVYLILRRLGFCHDISLCIMSYLERCFIDLEIARFLECDQHFSCVFTDFQCITKKGQSLPLAEYFGEILFVYDVNIRTLRDYVVFQREMYKELPFQIRFPTKVPEDKCRMCYNPATHITNLYGMTACYEDDIPVEFDDVDEDEEVVYPGLVCRDCANCLEIYYSRYGDIMNIPFDKKLDPFQVIKLELECVRIKSSID